MSARKKTVRKATPKTEPLAELEATVAKMRALGVTEWNGIKLGPEPNVPAKPLTKDELRERRARREERRRDIQFAASSIKPALPPMEKY